MTNRTQYVVIDDASWGETAVMTASEWEKMRPALLDEWDCTLEEAGGDPAMLLEDYVEKYGGADEHVRNAAAICSGRAQRELRRLCRQFSCTER